MNVPEITIRYFGGGEPDISLPDELKGKVIFKLIDAEEEWQLVVKWEDLGIYRTEWKNGIASDYWYGTYPRMDSDDSGTFDIRDLPACPEADIERLQAARRADELSVEDVATLAYAIEQDLIDEDGLRTQNFP